MRPLEKFCWSISLRNGCRLIGVGYTTWSYLNFVFNLATFSSPNFNILIAYHLLPERVDTFGRMWFALSSLLFWIVHIVVDVLLFVGVQQDELLLVRPFIAWTTVGVIWEFFFAMLLFATFDTGIQVVVVFFTLVFDVMLPIYCIYVVVSYVLLTESGKDPSAPVILRNARAASQENIARDHDKKKGNLGNVENAENANSSKKSHPGKAENVRNSNSSKKSNQGKGENVRSANSSRRSSASSESRAYAISSRRSSASSASRA